MFVSAPRAPKIIRNKAEVTARIKNTIDALAENRVERDRKILHLFEAHAIDSTTPIMSSGWKRPLDEKIVRVIAGLLARRETLSLLEIGAGTTWGCRDSHFGVPGLARALKQSFPDAIKILATDRERGFDIFLVLPDGLLTHHQYRDDRPPLALEVSRFKGDGVLRPIPAVSVAQCISVDKEFRLFLETQGYRLGLDLLKYPPRIYIRPRIDSEVEALLYGVESLGCIDYTELSQCLIKANRRERFDFVYGRHLCPISSESRLEYLKDNLPAQLAKVTGSHFVQFDNCLVPDEGFGDLVFRAHAYF